MEIGFCRNVAKDVRENKGQLFIKTKGGWSMTFDHSEFTFEDPFSGDPDKEKKFLVLNTKVGVLRSDDISQALGIFE